MENLNPTLGSSVASLKFKRGHGPGQVMRDVMSVILTSHLRDLSS